MWTRSYICKKIYRKSKKCLIKKGKVQFLPALKSQVYRVSLNKNNETNI